MKKNRKYFYSFFKLIALTSLLAFFVFSFQKSSSKDDTLKYLKKLRLEVLEENLIGKDFEYDLTGQEGCNKTKLTYLGVVTTKTKKNINC